MKIKDSLECVKSELDVFNIPPTQTAIEHGQWDTIQPHPNFDQSPVIRFDIPGTNSHYIDLAATEFHLKFQLHDKDGKAPEPKTKITLVNNFLHSLFEQCQVYLNNVAVENSNKAYAYRAYLENLLCYGSESKKTFMRGDLFFTDDLSQTAFADTNTSLATKQALFARAKANEALVDAVTVPMCGKLHCDIFNINRYLINNVDIKIVLTKSPKEFYLIADTAIFGNYKLRIVDTFLKVRRVVISPAVMLAHAMALEKTTAKYPIKRVLVKPFVVPYSSSVFTLNGIHFGIMPTRVVCGIVATDAYNGTSVTNPFEFKPYNIKQLSLKVSSRPVPYSAGLKFDFDRDDYLEAYLSLYKNIRESGNDITYQQFKNGYTLFAFDLTPDLCSSEHFSLLRDGSLDLDVVLSEGSAETKTFIFYLEFDNIIEITKERQILVDYKL